MDRECGKEEGGRERQKEWDWEREKEGAGKPEEGIVKDQEQIRLLGKEVSIQNVNCLSLLRNVDGASDIITMCLCWLTCWCCSNWTQLLNTVRGSIIRVKKE